MPKAIDVDYLISSITNKCDQKERRLIELAIRTATKAHEGQKRASGESYITHCLSVASILADWNMDSKTIAAGVLHDTIEDTQITFDYLKKHFGIEIAKLVDGVTKMAKVENQPSYERQAINLRKTFQAMLDDVRVVIVKLADRLHNMQTLNSLSAGKRLKVAQETLDIFVPLAHRLGMWAIKSELEDLCFQHIYPVRYFQEKKRVDSLKSVTNENTRKTKKNIRRVIKKSNTKCTIVVRQKNLFLVSSKTANRDSVEHLVEIIPEYFLIVPSRDECYLTLGIIHEAFQPILNEFKDYIANPKDNLYQSLHTKVLIPTNGKRIKCNIIIRTLEMDNLANYGILSNWMFDSERHGHFVYNAKVTWLRAILGWMREISDASDFISAVQSDLFKAHVYVLSPNGDTYELPNGATPLDFAYVIHTEIGNGCRGALMEEQWVPLNYKLRDGDQIKILTTSQSEPKIEWLFEFLGLANTAKSRQAIKYFFRHQGKSYSIKIGKDLLDNTYRRLELTELADQTKLASQLGFKSLEEVYLRLGRTEINIEHILSTIDIDLAQQNNTPFLEGDKTIKGVGRLPYVICQSCKPQPLDQIVGLLEGTSIHIHRVDCVKFLDTDFRGKWLHLEWGGTTRYKSWRIEINAFDRDGLLYDIFDIFAFERANITYVFADVSDEYTKITVQLNLPGIIELNRLLIKLDYIPNVISAKRIAAD